MELNQLRSCYTGLSSTDSQSSIHWPLVINSNLKDPRQVSRAWRGDGDIWECLDAKWWGIMWYMYVIYLYIQELIVFLDLNMKFSIGASILLFSNKNLQVFVAQHLGEKKNPIKFWGWKRWVVRVQTGWFCMRSGKYSFSLSEMAAKGTLFWSNAI